MTNLVGKMVRVAETNLYDLAVGETGQVIDQTLEEEEYIAPLQYKVRFPGHTGVYGFNQWVFLNKQLEVLD